MTSPYPIPGPEDEVVMCGLCFVWKPLSDMSLTPEGQQTDVCKLCRSFENQHIVRRQVCDLVLDALMKARNGEQQGLVKLARETADKIDKLYS